MSNGTANYTTKRLKEEAIRRGHEVDVIKYKHCHAVIEQSRPILRYKGKTLEGYDAIIPRIA
ncbi:MAG: 30S ribosomal protein S6--L-glutamate ligase, partial [Candidatus Saccharimonadales bacterium]